MVFTALFVPICHTYKIICGLDSFRSRFIFVVVQNCQNLNMILVVTVVVCIGCFVHLGLLTENVFKGLFSNGPMMFGGFAAIFSQGLTEWFWVLITLTMGFRMGYGCYRSTNYQIS